MNRLAELPVQRPSIGLLGAGPLAAALDTVTNRLRQRPGSGVGMSRVESAVSLLTQGPLPAPERTPPLPPEVWPPPLDRPAQSPPEIREPDLPGEHLPISDGPRPAPAPPPAIVDGVRRGKAC